MMYEPYRKRKKPPRARHERRKRRGCLTRLIGLVIRLALIVALLAGILYVLPTGMFVLDAGDELSVNAGLPNNRVNVLLLGVDKINHGAQRSDAIMVMTVGEGEVKLTSFMRDMIVSIPGHQDNKLNSAYAYGGANLVMHTLNQNFGLNITQYATVDFLAFASLVDAVGGVEITISDKEREQININVLNARKQFAEAGYTLQELFESGENVHLNGYRALAYARIRKIDSDFYRTTRQRTVLDAIFKKLKKQVYSPVTIGKLAKAVIQNVDTNVGYVEIGSLGIKALAAGEIQQFRIPVSGAYNDNGSSLIIDKAANAQALKTFLYGT